MDMMFGILIGLQILILTCGHFLMYPDTLIANFVEKKFGDYGNALYIINGSQLILIIVTLIVRLFW